LRAAFDQVMKDLELLAEAKSLNLDVEPLRGVDMQKSVAHILATPPEVVRRAKHLLE
jgi:hypothetical protein